MAGFGDLLKAGASAVGSSISSQGGVGTGFIGGALSKVGEGAGIGEAIKGSAGDVFKGVKESLSPRNIALKAGNQFFGGSDVFSTFGRAVVNKQFGEKDTSGPTQMSSGGGYGGGGGAGTGGGGRVGGTGGGGLTGGVDTFIRIIAKNSMSIPSIARDVNIFRQNILKLVRMEGRSAVSTRGNKGRVSANRSKSFFERQKEASKGKSKAGPQKQEPITIKEDETGFLMKLLKTVGTVIVGAISSISIPTAAIIAGITGFLFSFWKGLSQFWDSVKEGKSFYQAFVDGLNKMAEAVTFGFFGDKPMSALVEKIGQLTDPIFTFVKDLVSSVKNWLTNNIGIPKITIPLSGIPGLKDITIGPYYPFKKDPSSEAPEGESKPTSTQIGGTQNRSPDEDYAQTLAPGAALEAPRVLPMGSGPPDTSLLRNQSPTLVSKSNGEKLKLPTGATYDSTTDKVTYKGVSFTANTQKDLDNAVEAVDNKMIVEYQGTDNTGKKVTVSIDGNTGQVSYSPPKTGTINPMAAIGGALSSLFTSGARAAGGASGATGGSVESGGGGEAPNIEGIMSKGPIGEAMSALSSGVADLQRSESAADIGSVIDKSFRKVSQAFDGKTPEQIAEVYNLDLMKLITSEMRQ
jgi:hypothetical protein